MYTIIIILLILWLLGAFAFNVGSLIHLLVIIAVILLVYELLIRVRTDRTL